MTVNNSTTVSKVCTKCGQEKPITAFWKIKGGKDGLKSRCIDCSKQYYKSWYKNNYLKIEITKRKCVNCNNDFLPTGTNQKYSSVQCRPKPEPKQNTDILINRVCKKCGIEFTPSIHQQKYCFDKCCKQAHKEANIALLKTEGLTKACFTCGIEKPLSDYSLQNTSIYGVRNHCKECEKKKYRIENYGDDQTTKCEFCGNDSLKENGKVYCGDKCKGAAKRKRDRISGKARPPRTPEQIERDRQYQAQKASTEEGRLARNAAMRVWKAANPEKIQEQRRKYAEKQGKQYLPRGKYSSDQIEKAYDQIIEQNARDAFRWWFAKKSDAEVMVWYEATGKPWTNPRLSEAEKYRLQYQLDPEFAIHERMRRQLKKAATNDWISCLIWQALKYNGESPTVTKMLGYTIAELRVHIERQFTKKMSWEKFMQGEIHIDHIHPKKLFDLSNPDEWRSCWSLPNLRPMWAKENISKSAKILTLL